MQKIKYSNFRFSLLLLTKTLCLGSLAFVLLLLAFIVGPLLWHGLPDLSFSFLFDSSSFAGKEGGVGPVLRATLLLTFLAISFAVLLGLPVAFLLSHPLKKNNRLMILSRTALDLLASTPSIVFGLFGNYFFVITLKLGYSILAGALTLAIMILPLFIRLCELELTTYQQKLLPVSFSHGLSEHEFAAKILLPASISSIGFILLICVSRAFGETAALLFTSGFSLRNSGNIFESGRTLSVHIFDLSLNVPGADQQALKSSVVLIFVTVMTSLVARAFIRKREYHEA